MKKSLIIIIAIVLIIVAIVASKYYEYRAEYSEIKQFNLQYESYYEQEIYGTEIATVINKAVDNNEKNKVEKQEIESEGIIYYFYVPNDENSIKIDIKILDNNTTYQMESLYQGQITQFVQNYNYIKFKCTKIEYNSAKKVSYLLFEQITQ